MKFIWTDPHIEEKALKELEQIFIEIVQIGKKNKAQTMIMLGDYFNKKNPTPKEYSFGLKWARRFKKVFKDVIFIVGNHDESMGFSAIEYLKCVGIKVIKEYIDKDNNLYAHFMTNKSKKEYGTYERTVKELRKYNKVFLGHQHIYQELLKDKMYHPGSVRYISFSELEGTHKKVFLLNKNKLKEVPLKTPYLIYQINTCEIPNYAEEQLQKIKNKEKSKVKVVIQDFGIYKNEIKKVKEFKNKFAEFKIKLDFNIISKFNKANKENINFKKLFIKKINKIKDKDVRELLKSQMEEI